MTEKKNSEQRDAWICVSTSVRWVHAKPNDFTPLEEFSKFRGHFCLSLERLQKRATQKDVEEKVKPIGDESGPAFVVAGKLSGPEVPRFMNRCVRLVIITETLGTRNALMDAVRIRISPWQLLYKRMKEVLIYGKLSDQALNGLFAYVEKSKRPVENYEHETSCTFAEAVEEAAPIAEGLNVLSGFVETVATVVKKSVPIAKDVAEEVADLAKCVTVVSSALQVVVICASLAEMGMEMKRAKGEWPCIHGTVEDLREEIVKSMIPILHPDGQVKERLVKNVFEVQQELVDVLVDVENEMMRGSGKIESVKRFWKARKLRTIEAELNRLKGCAVQVVQSSSIAENSKALENIRQTLEKLEQNALPAADTFKSFFDSPSLPPNLVFDFESCDDSGYYLTPEGTLLDSVLQLAEKKNSKGSSALGTHGMGGVGKTTALKKICSSGSVRSLFVDGVCFMQFGQDATIQKVREEICRCVRKFGGVQLAKDMRRAQNLSEVVNRAAEWLDDRAVLLVCDDLWARDNNELGYLPELKNLLRDAPKSGLLISTRDRMIARAVSSSPVSFECVEPQGSKAKEILGRAAFGVDWEQITSNMVAELEYAGILQVCAGLPLALGIAGSGVNVDYEDSKDERDRKNASFAVKNYWVGLKEGSVKTLGGANAEYHADGLKYVVEASLKLCQAWGHSGGRNYDMGRLFCSLCILEKQQFLPESTLKLYWEFEGLDEMEAREVVQKFANLNLLKRERIDRSVFQDEQFCVRLHDLVLELCKKMEVEEQERWHLGLINAYRLVLEDGEVPGARTEAWWKVKDDGHVSGNLSRHLIASGCWPELEALVCDVRWTLRRYEMGGWLALELDFKRLLSKKDGFEKHGIRELHSMLKSCWAQLRLNQNFLGFYAFGYFSKEERRGRNVSEYLKSVEEHLPSPWLCPMTKCVFPADSREQSRWGFNGCIFDIAVSWSSERVAIASSTGIEVWPLWGHKGLFRIPIDTEESARCVAISGDAKLIVSGHFDGTVRRWDAHTGEPVGDPISNRMERVASVGSVAIRGNMIVSGSDDDLLYRYNATTGEFIGNALQGHEDKVTSVAISADAKLIVSGSYDRTIRRWNADTGEAVGSPIRGHSKSVESVAVSTDGELIVSGSLDNTVRRWRANTGEAIGEPLRGHAYGFNSLALSEDNKYIVSGSYSGEICLWDSLNGEAIGLPLQGPKSYVNSVAISREGKLILSGHGDGTVRHWYVSAQGNVLEEPCSLGLLEMPRISCIALSACGKLAVACSENGIQKWNISTGEAVSPLMRGGGRRVAISKDGTLIVSGDYDGTVRRWDGSTGESIGEPMYGHSDNVDAIVIGDDGKLIVTGSWDKTVRRWDAINGKAIGKPMEHCGGVEEVAISTDGSVILSGYKDGSIIRWNAETGEKIGEPIEAAGSTENLVISSNGSIFACGSPFYDFVQQWETATGEPVGERMKWSEGQHVLDEMRRARLYGEQERDAIVRKDAFPN